MISSFNMKISEWLGSISVTRVLETTLADHKWTDGGVKSDISTPIQGSSSVMNDYKNTARRLICTTGGGESKLGGLSVPPSLLSPPPVVHKRHLAMFL